MAGGHEVITKGGWIGHWSRRALHVGMIIAPWLYYTFHIPPVVLWVLMAAIVVIEAARLVFGLQFFGQRAHEVRRISSFAWGAVSLLLVLLLVPAMFAYPIIAGCAIGDPLIGELRRFRLSSWIVAAIGIIVIAGLWLIAWWWLATPWWWAIIMAPLTVASEWPNLTWIDDNATTQLIPLLVVLVVYYWF